MKEPTDGVNQIIFKYENREYITYLSICNFTRKTQSYRKVEDLLHPREMEYYQTLKYDIRKKSYLLGRYVAKVAIGALVKEKKLDNIIINQGVFSQPIVEYTTAKKIQTSITHCGDIGVAVAFYEDIPLGIDIERIDIERKELLFSQLTSFEKSRVKDLSLSNLEASTLLWTVKEALSKVLRTGFTSPLGIFEVDLIDGKEDIYYGSFKYFKQYNWFSYLFKDYIFTLVYPKNTEMEQDSIIKLLRG